MECNPTYLEVVQNGEPSECDLRMNSRVVQRELSTMFRTKGRGHQFLEKSFRDSKESGYLLDTPRIDGICLEVRAGSVIDIPSTFDVHQYFSYVFKRDVYFTTFRKSLHPNVDSTLPTSVKALTLDTEFVFGERKYAVKFYVLRDENCDVLGPVL